jgi:hypothetical protein
VWEDPGSLTFSAIGGRWEEKMSKKLEKLRKYYGVSNERIFGSIYLFLKKRRWVEWVNI